MPRATLIDMAGKQFGAWSVLSYAGSKRWHVRCACGFEAVRDGQTLRNGSSVACSVCGHTKHGGASKARGEKTVTPEWEAWSAIKKRCYNPNHKSYARYGGRGIKMAAEWLTNFPAFLEHVGPKPSSKHSIDRIDNDGNYEPGNVRWATDKQQMRNRNCSKLTQMRNRNCSKLTEIDAAFIRHWSARGFSYRKIAPAFEVTYSTVHEVVSGQIWRSE